MITFEDDVTELGADTFNAMQQSLLQDMEEKLAIINGETLYEDSVGTTGAILLSSEINTFKRIRITGYVLQNNVRFYFEQTIPVVVNSRFGIIAKSYTGSTYSYFDQELLTLGNTSITRGEQIEYGLGTNNVLTNRQGYVYITKIVGLSY